MNATTRDSSPPPEQDHAALFDVTVLPGALQSDDPQLLEMFYRMFLELSEDAWPQVGPVGQAADLPVVRHVAHKLRSSAASVGAMALAIELESLERAAERGDSASVEQGLALAGGLLESTRRAMATYLEELAWGAGS
jgi:HPt (histidine-containing phosphotransfer) domain-containing protein